MNKRYLYLLLAGIFILSGVSLTLLMISSPKNTVTLTNSADAQTCTAPTAVSGVTVAYPSCVGSNCDLTKASCTWTAESGVASYNATVTEVETSTIILNNASESASTTTISFPITQGKTYKCDITAVASCGAVSAVSSDQLLCEANALLSPTVTPVPTATPVPPKAPPPTIAQPGGVGQTIAITGLVLFAIVGGAVLLML